MANIMNTEYGGGDMQNEYERLMMQRTPRMPDTAQYDPTRAITNLAAGIMASPEGQALANMYAGARDNTQRLLMTRTPIQRDNQIYVERTPRTITGNVEKTPRSNKGNVYIPDEVVADNRYFLRAPGWAWPEDMDATTGQSLGGMNPANIFASKNTIPASEDYLLAAQILMNSAAQRKG